MSSAARTMRNCLRAIALAMLVRQAIEDIDAPTILLVRTNPVVEAPVLNARIRKAWSKGADVVMVGENVDLTYEYRTYGHRSRGTRACLRS